jgi:hypothetical protein
MLLADTDNSHEERSEAYSFQPGIEASSPVQTVSSTIIRRPCNKVTSQEKVFNDFDMFVKEW